MLNLLHRALPSQCAFCRCWPIRGPLGRVCDECFQRFQHRGAQCPKCALPLAENTPICGHCLQAPLCLEHCVAAVSYTYPWHAAIQQFKFRGDTAWAHTMAQILLQLPAVKQALACCSVVVPVPLSVTRLRERGYNQALLLARQIVKAAGAEASHLQLLHHGIARRHTEAHQTQLDRQQRLKSLQNTFLIPPTARTRIAKQSVLLVDDVKTTGATLDALASACLAAGAARVMAIAFAYTPPPES